VQGALYPAQRPVFCRDFRNLASRVVPTAELALCREAAIQNSPGALALVPWVVKVALDVGHAWRTNLVNQPKDAPQSPLSGRNRAAHNPG
jgi:hypothetical protein